MNLDELRGGATPWRDEADELLFEHGEGGISPAYSARLADEIMAETSTPLPDTTPATPRRNRHLDGFGGRHNA